MTQTTGSPSVGPPLPPHDMSEAPLSGGESDSDLSSQSSWSILDEEQQRLSSNSLHVRSEPLQQPYVPEFKNRELAYADDLEQLHERKPASVPGIQDNFKPTSASASLHTLAGNNAKSDTHQCNAVNLLPVAKVVENVDYDTKMRMHLEVLLAAHQRQQQRARSSHSDVRTALVLFVTCISIIGIALSCIFLPRVASLNQNLPASVKPSFGRSLYSSQFDNLHLDKIYDTPPPGGARGYEYKKSPSYYLAKYGYTEDRDRTKEYMRTDKTKSDYALMKSAKGPGRTSDFINTVLIGPKKEDNDYCPVIQAKKNQCDICKLFDDEMTPLPPSKSSLPTKLTALTPPTSPNPDSSSSNSNQDSNLITEIKPPKCSKRKTEQDLVTELRQWGSKLKRSLKNWLPSCMSPTIVRRFVCSNMFKMNFYLALHIINDIILLRSISKLKKDLQGQITTMNAIKKLKRKKSKDKVKDEKNKNKCEKFEAPSFEKRSSVPYKPNIPERPTPRALVMSDDNGTYTRVFCFKSMGMSVPLLINTTYNFDYVEFLRDLKKLKSKRVDAVKTLDKLARDEYIQQEHKGRIRDNQNFRETYASVQPDALAKEQLYYCLSYIYARKRDFCFMMKFKCVSPAEFDTKCTKFMRKMRQVERDIVEYFLTLDGKIPAQCDLTKVRPFISLLLARKTKTALRRLAEKSSKEPKLIKTLRNAPKMECSSEPLVAHGDGQDNEKSKLTKLSMHNFTALSICEESEDAPLRKTKVDREKMLETWKERYEQLKLFWKSRQEYYDKRAEVCQLIKAIIPPENALNQKCSGQGISQLATLAANAVVNAKPAEQKVIPPEQPTQSEVKPQPCVVPMHTATEVSTTSHECPAIQVLDDLIKNVVQEQLDLQVLTEEEKSVSVIDKAPGIIDTCGSDFVEVPDSEEKVILHASNELIDTVLNDIKMMFKEETSKVREQGARLKKKFYDSIFEQKMAQLQSYAEKGRQLLGGATFGLAEAVPKPEVPKTSADVVVMEDDDNEFW